MINIELDKIAGRDPKLYITICDLFLIRGTDDVKVLSLTNDKFLRLPEKARERVQHWQRTFELESDAAQQQRVAEDMEKQRKIDADTEAYKNRLMQYVNEQGLEPTIENADAIRKWIDEKVSKGHVSSNAADAAVSLLRKTLTWKPKVPAAPPTPPPPPAVILSDGSEQLPLTTVPSHKHSKTQLVDLDRRLRAEQKKDRKGWFSSTI